MATTGANIGPTIFDELDDGNMRNAGGWIVVDENGGNLGCRGAAISGGGSERPGVPLPAHSRTGNGNTGAVDGVTGASGKLGAEAAAVRNDR